MVRQDSPEDIQQTYLHVQDGGTTLPLPVSATFWQDLGGGAYPQLEQGRLMSAYTFSEPWAVWERHLAGEELVLLLSGAATLVLQEPQGEREVLLETVGAFVLVPKGVWHTARTSVATTLLFLTPGAGTEHRAV